jgi:hypothetical protein
MHRKFVFALAAVFLVVALVVPPTLVLIQTNNSIYKYINPMINPAQGTTNVTIIVTSQERQNYNNAITYAAIIEVIFILLFASTIYYGINHTHPKHKPGKLDL